MTFHVGQKVVCVDANSPSFQNFNHSKNLLINREIYTIEWVGTDLPTGICMVQLCELPTKNQFDSPIYYQAKRFRPLVERKTDISFAHEILRKASKRVDA